MIVDLIVHGITAVLSGLFGLLPSWNLAASFSDAGANLGGSLSNLDGVFPVDTLGICIAALLVLKGVLMVWDVVVWILDRILEVIP
jgi:hypothetical protein